MNLVTLTGNLGSDPESRVSPSGTTITKLSLATNDFNGKERVATWHRITVFGKQAEACAEHLQKGRQIAVSGRIQNSTFERDDGSKGFSTEIIANRVEFLGSAPKDQSSVTDEDASLNDALPPAA